MINLSRIFSIIRKEFIQIRRDPRTVALILLMPIMQLLLFGYAVSNTVDHIPTVVYDQDGGPASREFIAKLVQSQYFDVVDYVGSLVLAAMIKSSKMATTNSPPG